jgi:hypothetical protein
MQAAVFLLLLTELPIALLKSRLVEDQKAVLCSAG